MSEEAIKTLRSNYHRPRSGNYFPNGKTKRHNGDDAGSIWDYDSGGRLVMIRRHVEATNRRGWSIRGRENCFIWHGDIVSTVKLERVIRV